MANKVSSVRLYLTSDGSRVVKEGDPEAASLLVAEGGELTEAEVKQYGVEKYMTDAPEPYDAIADHAARHTPADAPVNVEDDEKALAPKANKAAAPKANKGE